MSMIFLRIATRVLDLKPSLAATVMHMVASVRQVTAGVRRCLSVSARGSTSCFLSMTLPSTVVIVHLKALPPASQQGKGDRVSMVVIAMRMDASVQLGTAGVHQCLFAFALGSTI